MRMLMSLCLAAGLATMAFSQTTPAQGEGTWTGYVTDTHCGAKGAVKDHTVACVEKCMRTGSKAQIMNESDQKIYDLDSFSKVRDLMGHKVTVKGTLDPKTNTITVVSALKADG
jgi:hypothetical protein